MNHSTPRLISGRKFSSRLIPGLTLVALGVLLTLNNLGVFPIERLWRFWPLLLIAFGLHRIWEPGSSSRGLGFALLTVGIALQFYYLGLFHLSLRQLGLYWPLILVAVGIHLIWSSRHRRSGLGAGLLVVFLGVWFQLKEFGWVSYPIWRLWPLILVAIGVGMVQKALRSRIWR